MKPDSLSDTKTPIPTKMMLLAAFAVLTASALALPAAQMGNLMASQKAGADGGNMMNSTDPQICCMPKTWQATLMDLKSDNALRFITIFATDGDMRVEGALTMPLDGGAPVYQEFTDYKSNTKYIVSSGSDGKMQCSSSKPDHDYYDSCFGGATMAKVTNMKFVGNSMLGGPSGIKTNAWSFTLDGMDITISLTENGCLPVLEGIRKNDNSPDNLLLFNDVSTNITDRAILTVPAACVNSAHAVVG